MESTAAATKEAAELFRDLVECCEAADAATRAALNLNITDFKALKVLCEAPGLGPGDLARNLGITTAATTAVLDRLEARGYIARSMHPTDRRRSAIQVQRAVLNDPWSPARALLHDAAEAMAAMPPAGRNQVLAYLREISARMRKTISNLQSPIDQQRSETR